MKTSALVLDYIKKFSTLSKSAVARKLFTDHPLVFHDIEDARFKVRYHTQAAGTKLRTKSPHTKLPDACIPKSVAPKRNDYRIKGPASILWISDIHIPNHDEQALRLALQYGLDKKVNTIVIGGDLLDNTPFSAFLVPPEANQVRRWFDNTYQFLYHLRNTFPEAEIIWIEGNHDNWYERFLMKKVAILFDDPHYHMETRLRLSELDIRYVRQANKVYAGKLILAHGHTLIRGVFSPVNAARGLFLRAKASTMIGHVHTTSEHMETTLKGDLIGCFSVGCLCTLSPDYDPHNTKHNQGFAHITTKADGDYHVDNKKIFEGKIL